VASCLVIGANGFLGSHLVDELVGLGHSVTAFDRFSSGEPAFSSPDAQLVAGDFLNRADLEGAVAGQDYVFHFLSSTTPVTVQQDPSLDIRTNVSQTVELLELAVAAGTKRFYFASSGGTIYGNQGKEKYTEKDRTLPVSPYGISKLTIERYLQYFRAQYGLDSLSFRISNPYGPRQHPNRRQGLIPIALNRIHAGLPVRRFGNGEMIRDYAYVTDVIRMIGQTVGVPTEHDTYNIGSGHGHSVNEVLATIRDVVGHDFETETLPAPPTFVERVVLNTDRYRDEFPIESSTPLAAGIRETWAGVLAHPPSLRLDS
jgi:UDP-glucose 4-epimerase